MKKIKKTAHEQFLEEVNRYEIKEFCASDLDHFYVRCVTKKGNAVLFRCMGDSIEQQVIHGDYDELTRSEHFFACMVKYLAKIDDLGSVGSLTRWHDYQICNQSGAEEPDKPFSLHDVWEMHLAACIATFEDEYEEE